MVEKKGTPLDYQERLREDLSWYKHNFNEKRLVTADGHSLRFSYQRKPDARAAVVVVNGRTEYVEKYIDVLRDLQMEGISFGIYDHCGQGDSDRLLPDTEKGHIDSFDRYVRDLHLVTETSHEVFGTIPVHLLCHSMGATIAWLFCAKYPGMIESLILSSPMFSIEVGVGLPLFTVESIARVFCQTGMGNGYVATTGSFDPEMSFDNNMLTTDQDRFAYNLYMTDSLPYASIGGPTYRWLCEAFTAMRKTKQVVDRIDCPVQFLAGSEDRVVGIDSIAKMADAVNGAYTLYDNARHELLMETPKTRNRALAVIRAVVQG